MDNNRDIYTLAILMAGTLWGVMVKYLSFLKQSKEAFSILIFLSEYFAHGFVGFLLFLVCKSLHIEIYLTLAISLTGAFMGLKILLKFEDEVLDGMDGISEKIKRWLK
jgi:hypothetical protein